MLEIKIHVAVDYPQKDCGINYNKWQEYSKKVIKNFETLLIGAHNGYSKQCQIGAYKMQDSGKIVTENSICYTVYDNEADSVIIEWLRDSLYQESILVTKSKLDSMEFV